MEEKQFSGILVSHSDLYFYTFFFSPSELKLFLGYINILKVILFFYYNFILLLKFLVFFLFSVNSF